MPSKKKSSNKKRGRKKTGATRHSERQTSFVNWMILLVLIGLFVTFLVYLDKLPTTGQDSEQPLTPAGQSAGKALEAEKRPPEHQFDFYTVLPDREVEVNVYEEDELPSAPRTTSKSVDTDQTHVPSAAPAVQVVEPSVTKPAGSSRSLYQLQVGAFKELAKADAMKARLAFMGVESNIYVVRSSKGEKIYRVRVGPNSDEKKLSKIQQQLKAQNINTFMQKLKG